MANPPSNKASSALAARALGRWNALIRSIELVSRNENTVFRFRTRAGRERYLRIAPPHYRPRGEIEAELDFVRHLDRQGIPVARPVRSIRGNWLETLPTPRGEMYAAVFEAVHGEHPHWGSDDHNRAMLRERGAALGRMHNAARRYRPTNGFRRFHWFEDDLFADPLRYFRPRDRVARREYQHLIEWMLAREATRENYGIVHGDFGSGNTVRHPRGGLIAFDFDDCCQHWYLYDLAVAIRSAQTLPLATRKAYARALLEGYAQEKHLGGDGVEELGQFCRLAALYRYVTVLRQHDRDRFTAKQRRLFNDRLAVLRNPVRWS